jgi:hypothetical protein
MRGYPLRLLKHIVFKDGSKRFEKVSLDELQDQKDKPIFIDSVPTSFDLEGYEKAIKQPLEPEAPKKQPKGKAKLRSAA